jgi:predicted enzyme related to lactoylglutathione lyase
MVVAEIKSKLVICNIPTTNSDAAQRFYGALLGGGEFAPAPNKADSFYRPISRDGIDLTITRRHDDHESWTCYFAVENLDRAIEELSSAGGEIVVKPQAVASASGDGEVGRTAVMLDPDKNHVGLIELTDDDAQQYFGLRESRELRAEQRP